MSGQNYKFYRTPRLSWNFHSLDALHRLKNENPGLFDLDILNIDFVTSC